MTHNIRKIHLLLPGLTKHAWVKGGAIIARKAMELLSPTIATQTVTYIDREDGTPYLDEVLVEASADDLFIMTWGPHVNELAPRLAGRRFVYYAQSPGWDIRLPVHVPIICLSRYLMAFWMAEAPYNPIFLLPPVLEPECHNTGLERDIEVLYLSRKSTKYLSDHLMPALEKVCHVHTVDGFIPRNELFELYNRSKVYVYSSAPWSTGWVEGFGFQPLEALVCGCEVFSNLHGGLSDYLEPSMAGNKLETISLDYDVSRVQTAVDEHSSLDNEREIRHLVDTYSAEKFHIRIQKILREIERLYTTNHQNPIEKIAASYEVPEWRRKAYQLRKQVIGR